MVHFSTGYWYTFQLVYTAAQTDGLITKYRFNMVRSSKVFFDQLCFGYTVFFVNDRIIKYAEWRGIFSPAEGNRIGNEREFVVADPRQGLQLRIKTMIKVAEEICQ